jgi:cytochrome c oxidase subunit IV
MALDTHAAHTHGATHDHVHGGPKIYGAVFGALVFLTVVTVGASYINWGSGIANVVIAMLIASVKASLVALFFMHLRWDKPITGIIFCVSLFFLGLFLIGCYTDLIARPPTEPTNLKAPAPGQQLGPAGGQIAPGGAAPAGPAGPPPNPAAQQGAHGGAAAGTNQPPATVPH